MSSDREIELKFLVPRPARKALATEMARASASVERRTLAAMYLDTPDRRLAREGIAWRLRREGRRWVQTLKAGGAHALERFEHECLRPDASVDSSLHAGTPVGDRLIKILRKAEAAGQLAGVRYRTEVRRILRRVRTRGAVVEVAFDEGRILVGDAAVPAGPAGSPGGPAGEAAGLAPQRSLERSPNAVPLRICEIEFELVSGSPLAMLALAERWRKRFGLILDPRTKAERGDLLAEGSPFPPLRKGRAPAYPRAASAREAYGAVLDECLDQIGRNAIGLVDGDPVLRVEHVHQMRVGIRRLRSGLRSFRGWVPEPAPDLVDGLRALFATLGLSRDADVLDTGVAASLASAGAPPLATQAAVPGPDPRETVCATEVQQLLLAWLGWRVGLAEVTLPAIEAATPAEGAAAPGETGAEAPVPVARFPRLAERRLSRWHRAIADAAKAFDSLDDTALHALRKRIKRQRYAAEFFAPVLREGALARYLKRLAAVQDRMGELNDMIVARDRYQAMVAADPAAWFALGWLAARIAELKGLARPELKRLARADPPGA